MATAKPIKKNESFEEQIRRLDPQIVRWFLIVSGELVFAVLLAALVIIPQLQSINQARANLEQRNQTLSDLRNKSDLLSGFSVQFAQKDDLIGQVLPDTKDVGLMLSSVRKVADTAGINIVGYSLNPGELLANTSTANPAQKASGLQSLTIDLTIDGSPTSTQKFLSGLNESLPLKSIENMQILRTVVTNTSTGSATQLLETKVSVRSYYMLSDITKDPASKLSPFTSDQQKLLGSLANYSKLDLSAAVQSTQSVILGNQNLFGL